MCGFHYQQSCHDYISNAVCCIFLWSAEFIDMTLDAVIVKYILLQ